MCELSVDLCNHNVQKITTAKMFDIQDVYIKNKINKI